MIRKNVAMAEIIRAGSAEFIRGCQCRRHHRAAAQKEKSIFLCITTDEERLRNGGLEWISLHF